MAKAQAVKFYVPPELMKAVEGVFERQGVKLSEGITRVLQHLVDAPESMRLIVLGQAHGDAAIALAEHVIARAQADAAERARHKDGPLDPVEVRHIGTPKRPAAPRRP
jgi:hypothetical protein